MTYISSKHLYETLKMNKISGKRETREDRNRIRRLMTFAFNTLAPSNLAGVHFDSPPPEPMNCYLEIYEIITIVDSI